MTDAEYLREAERRGVEEGMWETKGEGERTSRQSGLLTASKHDYAATMAHLWHRP